MYVKKLEIHNGTLENYPLQLEELVLVDSSFRKLEGFPLEDCPPIRKLRIERSSLDAFSLDVGNDIPLPLLQNLSEVSLNCVPIEIILADSLISIRSPSQNIDSLLDVSCFGTIRKLQFHNCQGITDVSSLSKVVELKLSYCLGIEDVSSLGKVYDLDLSFCYHIEDVSALRYVHTLNLNYCTSVTDVSALTNVYELHLDCFKGDELIGLENVVKLFLKNCSKVTDLSPLRKVKQLQIVNCSGISHFEPLEEYGQLRDLSIGTDSSASSNSREFRINSGKSVFKRLKKLELNQVRIEERSSLSWDDLTNIRELAFRGCDFSTFPVESFNHLQSLQFYRCHYLRILPELSSSLGTLVIEDCVYFDQINVRSSSSAEVEFPLYSLEIVSCPNLSRLEVSRKVSRFHLRNCKNLYNLVITNQIGLLQLNGCPVLRITMESDSQLLPCDILD
jgi:hypothetical protein